MKDARRVLITGGAGFIGSFLTERLLADGDLVHVLDNFSTGTGNNLGHLRSQSRLEITAGSIMDELLLESLIKDADLVYHLAAAVGVKYVVEHPVLSISTNIRGTENILRLCASHGRRVFVASSSEVYGRSTALPFKEDGELVFGSTQVSRWSYACGKALDEFLALAYHKQDGLDVRVGRLFNICGPRQTGAYGMVIPRFVRQALNNEPITVYGDGQQKRSFTFVADAIAYTIGVMEGKGTAGQIYNIGSCNNITILDLAEKIKQMTASLSKIIFVPYEETYEKGFEDMQNRIPDTAKLESVCGDIGPLGLDEILAETIEFHRKNL